VDANKKKHWGGGGGFSPQSEDVTVEFHLSGSSLSRSPNIRYGLVLGVHIFLR